MDAVPPLNLGLLALNELYALFAISVPSSPYRKLFFLPIPILAYIHLYVVGVHGKTPLDTYAVAIRVIFLFFTTLDYVFLRDAPKELRLIGDKTDISKASFFQRYIWAAKLLYSPRNIGWSHENPKHFPPRPNYASRSEFIRVKLRWWICLLFIHDVNLTLTRMNPMFKDVPPVFDGRVLTDVWQLLWRVHLGIGVLVAIIVSTEAFSLIIGVIWVACGFSDFKEWPWVFGSLYDAYSVRTFWRFVNFKAWHQTYRRMFVTPTDAIAHAIGLPRTGRFQRYFKLCLVFTFSAILHQVADCVQAGDWSAPDIMHYFFVQPPMIIIEDAVIEIARRAGIKSSIWTRTFGYFYVAAWFIFISPFWVTTEGPVGHFDYRMEWSLVDGLLRGNWKPYEMVR
ncbi:hypothetical protein CVT24_010827 [Panaeolus cyanescens]|uniref:Wax synthase domain-containing protein n=1 Tax=Panaeolus cyanescens TaxID=181874 RepID=A0A409VH20_9AGAR|nr:hypothetical protein CVT24_010827 [Panaeolus cyanescens]